jgi:hypothetical protein
MGKVRCVFCSVTRKRGKEHIWPQWLQQVVEGGTNLRTETHYAIAAAIVDRRTQQNKSLVLGDVCEACNMGWMSKLEQEVIPIFRPLLSAVTVLGTSVSAQHCSALARWAFKTAIVRNLATNYRKLVPSGHFTTLYETRTIPDDVYVDLALCPAYSKLGAVQSQTLSGVLTSGDEDLLASRRQDIYNVALGGGRSSFASYICRCRDTK